MERPHASRCGGDHFGLAIRRRALASSNAGRPRDPAPPAAEGRRCRKIIVHGLADSTVNPVNGERLLDEAERGRGPLARSDLDCETGGGRVRRAVLKDDNGRPVAEQWLVEGGGHAWFGGDPRGSYTQTVGLDASRAMVRFFLGQ